MPRDTEYKEIVFSGHAVRRMFQRGLGKDDVLAVIKNGEAIAEYPDDNPYPACLLLGFVRDNPVHVVFAVDRANKLGIVVTAYVPDAKLWSDDFRARR